MNVVDSSGWIEYLSGGPDADLFADAIQESDTLLVPTLSLFEVFKHVLRHAGREEALRVAAAVRRGTLIDLDSALALEAAELSVGQGLALADSVILATARSRAAVLWTQDRDFEGMSSPHRPLVPPRHPPAPPQPAPLDHTHPAPSLPGGGTCRGNQA